MEKSDMEKLKEMKARLDKHREEDIKRWERIDGLLKGMRENLKKLKRQLDI